MPSMIVAPEPSAVEAGAKVLKDGGNACDAAVTCALVQSVVDPHQCGIGGYLLANVRLAADGHVGHHSNVVDVVLDAPALAGSGVSETVWQDKFLGLHPSGWGFLVKGKVNTVGYKSVCTPGAVRGLAELLDRYGTIPWADALSPATSSAEEGFVVTHELAWDLQRRAILPEDTFLLDAISSNAEASRVFLKEGRLPYGEGEVLRNLDYASTLRHVATSGPDDFYLGELAERMSADIVASGGFLRRQDFEEYRTRTSEPLRGSYRGHVVSTSGPPHGGPTMLGILNILDGWDLSSMEHNSPEYIYRVSMAMKAAFADRNAVLGDPRFASVPLRELLSESHAAAWRERIDRGEVIETPLPTPASPQTSHVSVVDEHGNCVALTTSLGSCSGVVTPGLGFMYNNSMTNFHPLPGRPNSIAPGKGRTTGMSPTVVSLNGTPIMTLGAPGGNFIITSVLQVILNVLDFGMSIEEAVQAPRFDCQGSTIRCHIRIPDHVCAEVRKRHPIERLPLSYGGLGLVHAIAGDPASGKLTGAADAGGGGMPLST